MNLEPVQYMMEKHILPARYSDVYVPPNSGECNVSRVPK